MVALVVASPTTPTLKSPGPRSTFVRVVPAFRVTVTLETVIPVTVAGVVPGLKVTRATPVALPVPLNGVAGTGFSLNLAP
jgi:hypothetical protein